MTSASLARFVVCGVGGLDHEPERVQIVRIHIANVDVGFDEREDQRRS
jgi:hypothetical protein